MNNKGDEHAFSTQPPTHNFFTQRRVLWMSVLYNFLWSPVTFSTSGKELSVLLIKFCTMQFLLGDPTNTYFMKNTQIDIKLLVSIKYNWIPCLNPTIEFRFRLTLCIHFTCITYHNKHSQCIGWCYVTHLWAPVHLFMIYYIWFSIFDEKKSLFQIKR